MSVPGARLHYLDWGGAGPNLILIHGYQDNPHIFDDLASALTDQARVVAYARRGHGRSSKTGPFDPATLTGDLKGLMDSLRIDRAYLAGWSMGGNEITAMAKKYPDRVSGLIYLDGAYDWADSLMIAADKEPPFDFAPTASDLASFDAYRAWLLRLALPSLRDPDRVEAYVRDLVDVQPDGSVRSVMSDTTAAQIQKVVRGDHRDYSGVTAPALAIYAESMLDLVHGDSVQREKSLAWEDKYMRPFRARSIALVKQGIRGVEVVTVPGTHMDFVFTSREPVIELMKRFLRTSKAE